MAIALIGPTSTGKAAGGQNSATTTAVSMTGATLLIQGIGCQHGVTMTETDSSANTWTGLTAKDTSNISSRIWYVNGTPTVSGSHTGTSAGVFAYTGIVFGGFSGVATTSALDVQNGATTASATSLATGSVTPSVNNCLVITHLCLASGGGSGVTVPSGYTLLDFKNQTTSVNYGTHVAFQIQTTATATNPSWSWTGSSEAAATVAVFKPQAATSWGPQLSNLLNQIVQGY